VTYMIMIMINAYDTIMINVVYGRVWKVRGT
jgi:hypothetical protein